MKFLSAYTIDYIKRNKKNSIAIMIALLMTSTMLSALCGYLYNMYADNLNYILNQTGNWHGQLGKAIPGSKLEIIYNYDSIESVMIKGNSKLAKIDDSRRDYLIWYDANEDYWKSMPEGQSSIMEGRMPENSNEIAISKQYFEHHPDLKIGDIITFPTGHRAYSSGELIDFADSKKTGEVFVKTGEATLTIVGKLDTITSSSVPAYTALGYLDSSMIKPDDALTIYLRFKDILDTYKILPNIAKTIGYQLDEYGEYMVQYNSEYLSRKFVIPPKQMKNLLSIFSTNQMVPAFIVIGLLVAGLFVIIIHNAFAISADSRLKQIGILASIGATPKQIKKSVILEALILTAIPLPLGLFFGQFSIKLLFDFINQNSAQSYKLYNPSFVAFHANWQSLVPAIVLSLLTVYWSSLIPAKRVSKMSPIDAIRQGGNEKLKKPKKFSLGKIFGLEGELAGNALQARKKSYRTSTISLTLSFLTLCCFLCINSASTASKEIYQSDVKYWKNSDILLTMYNVPTYEDFSIVTEELENINSIQYAQWYNQLRAALWASDDMFSDEFHTAGGFAAADKILPPAQKSIQRDRKYRIDTILIGLDDKSFEKYCISLNVNPDEFYQDGSWKAIMFNSVNDITSSTKRNTVNIPFLNIDNGNSLTFTEKTFDSYPGDFEFEIESVVVTDSHPQGLDNDLNSKYSIYQFMPIKKLNELSSYFTRSRTNLINGILCVDDLSQIESSRKEVERICESYFDSGDYNILDENEYYSLNKASQKMLAILFGFISGLLAIIGLSNSWFTVHGILNARRKEFAMLRSVGLSSKGLKKMLNLEAVLLGLSPILISIPIIIIFQALFLYINEVSFIQWLPYAPWIPLLIYSTAILGVTASAYIYCCRKIIKDNIIEAIKTDTI